MYAKRKQYVALLLVVMLVHCELVSASKVFKIAKKIKKFKKILPLLLLGPKIIIINKRYVKLAVGSADASV